MKLSLRFSFFSLFYISSSIFFFLHFSLLLVQVFSHFFSYFTWFHFIHFPPLHYFPHFYFFPLGCFSRLLYGYLGSKPSLIHVSLNMSHKVLLLRFFVTFFLCTNMPSHFGFNVGKKCPNIL